MNLTNKIKAMLQMRGKKNKELAEYLELGSAQALTNKFNRGSFSAEDLIKIAAFLNAELAFILPDNQKISLDLSDIRKTAPETEAAERGD